MEQVSFLESLFSLSDKKLHLLLAVLDKVNSLELLSERFTQTLEREVVENLVLTRNECIFKILQRFNGIVRNEFLQFSSKEDLVHNLSFLIDQGVELLQKHEKTFQGDSFLDLLVFEGEKVFEEIDFHSDEEKMQACLLHILDKSDLMLKSFSANKLREKIFPFLLYYIFSQEVSEEKEVILERVTSFLSFWQEKKGQYSILQKKWEELKYSIELEERLLEQKQLNGRNLQEQLDEMNDEIDKIKKVMEKRIPHDARKLEGLLEGKSRVIAEKIAIHEDELRLSLEKNPDKKGILQTLWKRIDQGITGMQLEKEIKKLAGQLVEQLIMMKKDLVRLPLFYGDRVKMILENESRIQENRRWRYQLEQEIDVHQGVIKQHRSKQKVLEQEMNELEIEFLQARS